MFRDGYPTVTDRDVAQMHKDYRKSYRKSFSPIIALEKLNWGVSDIELRGMLN